MPDYEHDIATYLTLDGKVFIAPQYNIAFDNDFNDGGACPDFVALDLMRMEIIIVEVTAAWNLNPLISRVKQRRSRWYAPLQRKLANSYDVDLRWKAIRFLGFVRKDRLDVAKAPFQLETDVAFSSIETAICPWEYWTTRIDNGLPR